jgi:1-acyl-sn-glycerol-3-phosphate acyltransferase
MKITIKAISLILMIASFCAVGRLVLLLVTTKKVRAKIQGELISLLSRVSLFILGIQISCDEGREPKSTALIVANHLSYVDILIIASRYPAIFVTSKEVSDDPVLGMITRAAGCLYVNRRSPFRLREEIASMRDLLAAGISVAFFPEGTTTDGKSILKFKSPLFQASVDLPDVKVKTLCLVYTHANGESLTPAHADQIFYYGDMTFAAQFKKLLSLSSIRVSLEEVGDFKVAHRKVAAHTTRRKILEGYFSNCGLATSCSV